MTMVPAVELAECLGLSRTAMNRYCAEGVIPHGGPGHWWCDLEEAMRVLKARQANAWRPLEREEPTGGPVGSDGVTDKQREYLLLELRFHEPVAIRRLRRPRHALRIEWDDGETYTLLENGETVKHVFTKEAMGDGR
jgi:hypothetical protein